MYKNTSSVIVICVCTIYGTQNFNVELDRILTYGTEIYYIYILLYGIYVFIGIIINITRYGSLEEYVQSLFRDAIGLINRDYVKQSYAGCLATWKTWKSGKINSLREIMENSGKIIKTQGKL